MRRVFHTLAVHLFFIILFAFFYYYFSPHFANNKPNTFNQLNRESGVESLVDYVYFSTTIQAGVGLTDMLPVSIYGKLLVTLQHLIMLSITVITIYVFTN